MYYCSFRHAAPDGTQRHTAVLSCHNWSVRRLLQCDPITTRQTDRQSTHSPLGRPAVENIARSRTLCGRSWPSTRPPWSAGCKSAGECRPGRQPCCGTHLYRKRLLLNTDHANQRYSQSERMFQFSCTLNCRTVLSVVNTYER